MSEQEGGLLTTNQSFHFDREKVKQYRNDNIDSGKFFAWEKDHMYKSTYNALHGPVHLSSSRITMCPKTQPSPATKDLFQDTEPTAFLPRAILNWPSNPSIETNWM